MKNIYSKCNEYKTYTALFKINIVNQHPFLKLEKTTKLLFLSQNCLPEYKIKTQTSKEKKKIYV